MPSEDRLRARNRVLLAIIAIAALFGLSAIPATSAEPCGTAPRGLQVLDPGSDDSGIGGTGFTPPNPPPNQPRPQSSEWDESGLGGTGLRPDPDPRDDSGVGGTGLFGRVSGSGRICVNGLEVEIPESLALESVSGDSARPPALAEGVIVFVIARQDGETLLARRVLVQPSLSGRIDSVEEDASGHHRIVHVSGQRLRVPKTAVIAMKAGATGDALVPGQWIAVHGFRAPDRSMLATRIETGAPGIVRLPDPAQETGLERMLRMHPKLAVLSLEGFVTGDRTHPRIGGLAIERSSNGSAIAGALRPGAHIRVDGIRRGEDRIRIDTRPSLPRLAPPERPESDPRRDLQRDLPKRGPGREIRPERPQPPDGPPVRPDVRPPVIDLPRPEIERAPLDRAIPRRIDLR